MSECVGKIDVLTTTDKAATCKYYGDSMACYPKCYCDDANYKTSIELVEKSLKDAGCGTIKCGSAASLSASSAVTVLIATVVALASAR